MKTDLAEHRQEARELVAIAQRPDRAEHGVGEQQRARHDEALVAVADVWRARRRDTAVVPHRMTRMAWPNGARASTRDCRKGGERRRAQPEAPPMSEAAGPSRTTKIAVKVQGFRANRIIVGGFAASRPTSHHRWRFVRITKLHLRKRHGVRTCPPTGT